jgi:hypothetical protein
MNFREGGLSESESARADELVREKYDHAVWMERA